MRSLLACTLVTVAAGLSAASAPEPAPDWEAATDFPLEVGIGWEDFRSYEEIGELQLQAGFQGGQHINASLRAEKIEAGAEYQCSVWIVDPEAGADAPAVEGPEDRSCSFSKPEDIFAEEGGPYPDELRVFPSFRLVIDDADEVVEQQMELRVQVETDDEGVGRAWYRGDVGWMPEGDDPT